MPRPDDRGDGDAAQTDAEHAERAARLAVVYARSAAWWRLLAHRSCGDREVHQVFRDAAILAASLQVDRARFWRDAAADWRARAEQRPTSDAAGALSNWDELGVTA